MCLKLTPTTLLLIAAALSYGAVAAEEPTPFDPVALLKRAAIELKQADRDGDQQVTLAELLASHSEGDRDDLRRRFADFDFNHDDKLSRDEFLKLLSPTDQRPEISDPMVEMENAALVKWKGTIGAADRGRDGALTRDEWPGKQIARDLPALAGVGFDLWDRNQDGQVNEAEGRWLLEVAYGLTQLDGRPLRTPTGRVLSWYFFRALDANHDAVVSRQEFIERMFLGRERNATFFDELDADHDGGLSTEETWAFLWHDTLASFFTYDRNLDGYMTTDEFISIGWGEHVAPRSVRAFDDDGDGKISYREFRETTFANQASDLITPRRDADHDGRLSFEEFYVEKPPLLIAQCRFFFDRFDLDHDGFLSLDEFDFDAEFAKCDADRDGELTMEEFLAPHPAFEHADRKRRFLVFDFDANGKLDAEEFGSLSSPIDERGQIPDPIVELERAALAKWEAIFAETDREGGGGLSISQWPARRTAAEIPMLAEVPFEQWDRDGDGRVTQAEGRWLLEVAYGLTQLDGRPLRTPTGRVFSWYYFRRMDADHDGLIAREELLDRHYSGREKNAEVFAALDADRDGRLTDRETLNFLWHDTISNFLEYDGDGDGYLTTEELLGIGWGTNIERRSVRAFDDDHDGKLSFREFRHTTFANQASEWTASRTDANNDGRLSWQEFYLEKSPLLIAQSRYFFDRFDLDKNGFLSLDEFEFQIDPLHIALLLEVQFMAKVGELTADESERLRQEGERAIARRGNRVGRVAVGGQRVVQRQMVVINGRAQAVDEPLSLVVRRELTPLLKLISRGGWEKFDAERERLETRRKQAAMMTQLAELDLSSQQWSKFCELLATPRSDAWWRPTNVNRPLAPDAQWQQASIAGGGLGGFVIPEAELAAIFRPAQLAAFKELQRTVAEDLVVVQQAAGQAVPPGAAPVPAVVAPVAPPARAAVAMAAVAQGRQGLKRVVVRRGAPVEEQQRRLSAHLQRLVDDVDAACELTPAQRDKLLLAGKLDIDRVRESSPPLEMAPEGQEVFVQVVQVPAANSQLPVTIFDGESSAYQKALRQRLPDDQKQKLAEAQRERREFRRQALVEAVVCGLARAAALTSAQCDELSFVLNEAAASDDEKANWRADCLRCIAQLPAEKVATVLFDFQLPAASQQLAQLAEVARQLEAQAQNVAAPPPPQAERLLGIPAAP